MHFIYEACFPSTSQKICPEHSLAVQDFSKERAMGSTLLQDLRYALRQVLRTPGFTATVILTLALGIGANAAIFTLVHAVMLRDLPVADPKTLVRLGDRND